MSDQANETAIAVRRCAAEEGCDGIPLPFDLACDRHPACAECGGRIMHDIGCHTARAERLLAAKDAEIAELRAELAKLRLDRLGRHGYTSHGHGCCEWACGPRPNSIARCGGPGMCVVCGDQRDNLHAAAGEGGAG